MIIKMNFSLFKGESGKHLAKEILSKNLFKSTTLIGRRIVTDNDTFQNGVRKLK
jgi:hypothetical protein